MVNSSVWVKNNSQWYTTPWLGYSLGCFSANTCTSSIPLTCPWHSCRFYKPDWLTLCATIM